MPVEASPALAVYWTPRIMTVAAPESVLSPQSFVPAGQWRSVFLAACIQQRPPGEGGSGRPHQWYSSRRAEQCSAEPSRACCHTKGSRSFTPRPFPHLPHTGPANHLRGRPQHSDLRTDTSPPRPCLGKLGWKRCN